MMQPDPDRVTGVLKKWIDERGFGFLAADGLDDEEPVDPVRGERACQPAGPCQAFFF